MFVNVYLFIYLYLYILCCLIYFVLSIYILCCLNKNTKSNFKKVERLFDRRVDKPQITEMKLTYEYVIQCELFLKFGSTKNKF